MSFLTQTDFVCSVRGAHTISFGKGVNYFPSLSKHGRPASISQVRLGKSTSSQQLPQLTSGPQTRAIQQKPQEAKSVHKQA